MSSADYAPPVDKLLTYGEPSLTSSNEWPNYLELGIGPEHIPDLIRMAKDEELNDAETESLEVWAPIHAVRALGQLHAEAAIEPLVDLLQEQDDDDWMREELPEVFGLVGSAAIPALTAFLTDSSHGLYPRASAANALVEIGKMHPELRSGSIAAITRQLELLDKSDDGVVLNGFLISDLVDLKAVEALPLIERAFATGSVDEMIIDWDDVQVDLGLKKRSELPKTKAPLLLDSPDSMLRGPRTPLKFSGSHSKGKKKKKKGK
jgi:Protein of unknown function (DUF1186)/HEAT repeats